MAADLAADGVFEVTVADASAAVLGSVKARAPVECVRADLSDPAEVHRLVSGHDLVVGALPSVLGFAALKAVIDAGRSFVDISFMAEDPRTLGQAAQDRGVTGVYDCGVAPGMSNMFAGRAAEVLDPCESIELLVGGIPALPRPPFHYKAAFAPADVIEEYVRPATVREAGKLVVHEALSGVETVEFPGVGTLEAFFTDGLRSLLDTVDVPDLREKTLRYPGHAAQMRTLRDAGLFRTQHVELHGHPVIPREVAAALLFPLWTYEPGEADLTALRATAVGVRDGARTRLRWELLDRYDPATDTRSMSRTTAYPATQMARMIATGRFRLPGVHPPEIPAGQPGLLETLLEGLELRGVRYRYDEKRIP